MYRGYKTTQQMYRLYNIRKGNKSRRTKRELFELVPNRNGFAYHFFAEIRRYTRFRR